MMPQEKMHYVEPKLKAAQICDVVSEARRCV